MSSSAYFNSSSSAPFSPTGHAWWEHREYPDPFLTFAAANLPSTHDDILRQCEHIWYRVGAAARALKRAGRYFLSEIELKSADDGMLSSEIENKYIEIFKTLRYRDEMGCGIDNYLAYGNLIMMFIAPFDRFLECPQCLTSTSYSAANPRFSGNKFSWHCPKCKKFVYTSKPTDRPSKDVSRITIKIWDPHYIDIDYHPITEQREYYYRLPPDLVQRIRSGDNFILESIPWSFVEAVNKNKPRIKLNSNEIIHFASKPLAGVRANGWGVSELLHIYDSAFYIQMAKLADEVLNMEYTIPTRVISPDGASTNPTNILGGATNRGTWLSKIQYHLAENRKHPGRYLIAPEPVRITSMGGEGIGMTNYEKVQGATDDMLSALGVPVELYKSTLSLQVAPVALRLFEQSWMHLPLMLDAALDKFVKFLQRWFDYPPVFAHHSAVRIRDDLERRPVLLSLMASQAISPSTALKPWGIDADEERKRTNEGLLESMEDERELQAQVSQKQQLDDLFNMGTQQQSMGMGMPGMGAAPPQGGMMPPGGIGAMVPGGLPGSSPITPDQMNSQAQQVAMQLVQIPDLAERKRQLGAIESTNKTFYALVKQKMQDIRSEGRSMGQQMGVQQVLAQGGPTQ